MSNHARPLPAGIHSGNDWKPRHIIWLLTGLAVIAAIIVLISAPLPALLGSGLNPTGAAIHGLLGSAFMLAASVGLYLSVRLFTGRYVMLADLRLTAAFMPIFCLATIIYGNWIYIWYRLPIPSSPRSYFLAEMPAVHKVFFEFKEFASLFTLPLTVALSFLAFRYGERVLKEKWLRLAVAALLALIFFYGVVGYGLGAAITRLKSI